MKSVVLFLLMSVGVIAGIAAFADDAGADVARKVPAFEMKDLEEREHRLTDDKFKGKKLLIAAFGTWQQVSVDQAREIEKFHKAHPEVEIIAFVIDALPAARDFVQREGLSYPCYKTDYSTRADQFNKLFKTRKGKTLTLNRIPFVMLADADRNIEYAELGLVTAETLGKELK